MMPRSQLNLAANRFNKFISAFCLVAPVTLFSAPTLANGTSFDAGLQVAGQESETVASLINTDWEQPGHFGHLHIDAANVSGDDGCNQFSGIDRSGVEAGLVFRADGQIVVSEHWKLVTTLRACLPAPVPNIELPSRTWVAYQLDGEQLKITTESGYTLVFTKKYSGLR